MSYIYSLILGVIQGITEFLPVSSSGHLIILHNILGFKFTQDLAFDVALHLGTALALIIYFRHDLYGYWIALRKIFQKKGHEVNQRDLKDIMLIVYATIPALVLGFIFDRFIEGYFRSNAIVAITLFVVAILFFVVEKYSLKEHDYTGLNLGKALYIGFAQALALIPGVSRSGITIIAGMSLKLKRSEAAKFSFLLSIPVVLCAGLYKMLGVDWLYLPLDSILDFSIGFVSAAIIGFVAIKYFLKFVEHHKLNIFAWYRIGLALLLIGSMLI